jgi:hypothetical protein
MALSANTNYDFRNVGAQKRYSGVVVTALVIYKGALVVRTQSSGKLRPAANATGTTFLGIATAGTTSSTALPVTGASDGSVLCEVVNDVEALLTLAASVTIATAGSVKLYCVDDASVTTSNTLGPEVGTMVQWVSTTTGWIGLRQSQLTSAS